MHVRTVMSCFSPSQDCCTELEARGAGAAHAQTRSEKLEQVSRDIPRTSYRIQGEEFGCAMGDQIDNNIKQKQVKIHYCFDLEQFQRQAS